MTFHMTTNMTECFESMSRENYSICGLWVCIVQTRARFCGKPSLSFIMHVHFISMWNGCIPNTHNILTQRNTRDAAKPGWRDSIKCITHWGWGVVFFAIQKPRVTNVFCSMLCVRQPETREQMVWLNNVLAISVWYVLNVYYITRGVREKKTGTGKLETTYEPQPCWKSNFRRFLSTTSLDDATNAPRAQVSGKWATLRAHA